MIKVVLFSPTGYVGTFIKERVEKETDLQLIEMSRSSHLDEYRENYDIMLYSASVSEAQPKKHIQDNVLSALQIIDFCKKHNVKRIIYLSSDSIYGDLNVNEVTENVIMVNPGIYGMTKYLAERIIMESEIPYYIIRMPGIVGRIWRKTYLCRVMDQLRANEDISVYNADKEFNNVLDIDDLIDFLMLLCRRMGNESKVFLLGNEEKIILSELIGYIKKIYNSKSKIIHVSGENRRYFTLDIAKAHAYGYSSKKLKTIIENLYLIQEKMEEGERQK
ncbi:MAG: NAD(P)-dependent oxidoreductase [Lachnospiraceae bacterium]|nr:NAD(P)-dependent oxidoreductase [Lachnospiraceae bacterium]